ncbi:MAG: hypothetical protein EG824_06885 [Deltaproteobacteria bacterium]|nr:hypothetical protein [Deltaproteobacteria bacterium]
MGWRDHQKGEPLLKDVEKEYNDLLSRFWADKAEDLPAGELNRIIARLDSLYQELTRKGRRVPVLTDAGRAYLREAMK